MTPAAGLADPHRLPRDVVHLHVLEDDDVVGHERQQPPRGPAGAVLDRLVDHQRGDVPIDGLIQQRGDEVVEDPRIGDVPLQVAEAVDDQSTSATFLGAPHHGRRCKALDLAAQEVNQAIQVGVDGALVDEAIAS